MSRWVYNFLRSIMSGASTAGAVSITGMVATGAGVGLHAPPRLATVALTGRPIPVPLPLRACHWG